MFKLNEQVLIKEVHRKYGRSTSTVEMLEDIQTKGLVGKVITTDMSDGMLNTYVSFEGAESNIWFNDEELTKYYPFRLLNGTIEGIIGEFENLVAKEKPMTVSNEQVSDKQNDLYNLSDDMKIELFDYLVKEVMEGKGIEDKENLFEVLMYDYVIDLYTDMLIDDSEFVQDRMSTSETKEVVKYLLDEFMFEFNIELKDLIKKFK